MKITMFFPPQWNFSAPSIGIPILQAQLKKYGYEVDVADTNIDFFIDILNPDFLNKKLDEAKILYSELKILMKNEKYSKRKIKKYPLEIQSKILKYETLKDFFSKKESKYREIIPKIQASIALIKDKDKFYNILNLVAAISIIEKALYIAFLTYSPTRVTANDYKNELLELTIDNIKFHCFSKENNIFLDYFSENINKYLDKETKLATISINSSTQIIPGLTLSHIIKSNYNIPVCIGGDYFRRVTETLRETPIFFDLFCDYILIGDGEKSIVELAQYIDNKLPIDKVSGVIYKKNTVIMNPIAPPPQMNDVGEMDFEGFDLSKYITPEIVLPIKSNRHCSWGKCTFCDLYYGGKYSEKSPELLIAELKKLQSMYGISNFEFIDSSVSAHYHESIADLILKEDLKINYCSFARIEKAFTKDILQKAFNAGLKVIYWGYEAASKRVLKLMNKKTDYENRMEIIDNSYNIGIWNALFVMIGFPGETVKEIKQTEKEICENSTKMPIEFCSLFELKKHSIISEKIKNENSSNNIKNNITNDFYQDYRQIYDKEDRKNLTNYQRKIVKHFLESYKAGFPLYRLLPREFFFLYLVKYSAEGLRNDKQFYYKKTKFKLWH